MNAIAYAEQSPETQAPSPTQPHPPRQYLRPRYVEHFRCIGPACEDTCCQGWSVPVDQATYEKYISIDTMQPHLGTVIVPNTGPQNGDFARISTSTTAACFFLDEERLCTIQKQLGPEFLSATCATYPRSIAKISGQEERSLNLSCPEAARLTLLDSDLLGDGAWPANNPERYATILQDAVRLAAGELPAYDPLLATREFALLLLTDRRHPLWQRLLLLGTVVQQLQTLSEGSPAATFAAEHPDIIAQLLSDSARFVSQDTVGAVMDQIQIQPDEQLPRILELLRLRVSQQPIAPRLLECIQEFEKGLGCTTPITEAQLLATFSEAYRSYFRPLIEQHPHLLENYLANYVFKNNYPFGKQAGNKFTDNKSADQSTPETEINANDQHLLLCAQLAMLQTVLIGMAAHHREAFDATHAIKLVQSLAKTVEHSQPFLRQITTFVAERNLNSLRGVALLLKPNA
ncbi:MAG TPA: flagellin lysine-N-methylase [Granulicella sp.]|jgi:lysine-N-methylase|nr:flagellin lysine-N-methylase [Granulicella sp.]